MHVLYTYMHCKLLYLIGCDLNHKHTVQYVYHSVYIITLDTTKENKRWENPQMYLEMGSQGTYYTLYNFKCTHPIQSLTQDTLKELKVAGLLRYKVRAAGMKFPVHSCTYGNRCVCTYMFMYINTII